MPAVPSLPSASCVSSRKSETPTADNATPSTSSRLCSVASPAWMSRGNATDTNANDGDGDGDGDSKKETQAKDSTVGEEAGDNNGKFARTCGSRAAITPSVMGGMSCAGPRRENWRMPVSAANCSMSRSSAKATDNGDAMVDGDGHAPVEGSEPAGNGTDGKHDERGWGARVGSAISCGGARVKQDEAGSNGSGQNKSWMSCSGARGAASKEGGDAEAASDSRWTRSCGTMIKGGATKGMSLRDTLTCAARRKEAENQGMDRGGEMEELSPATKHAPVGLWEGPIGEDKDAKNDHVAAEGDAHAGESAPAGGWVDMVLCAGSRPIGDVSASRSALSCVARRNETADATLKDGSSYGSRFASSLACSTARKADDAAGQSGQNSEDTKSARMCSAGSASAPVSCATSRKDKTDNDSNSTNGSTESASSRPPETDTKDAHKSVGAGPKTDGQIGGDAEPVGAKSDKKWWKVLPLTGGKDGAGAGGKELSSAKEVPCSVCLFLVKRFVILGRLVWLAVFVCYICWVCVCVGIVCDCVYATVCVTVCVCVTAVLLGAL
jgi:hypothetical protein